MRAILTRKLEMTHIFDEAGNFIPVTVLGVEENVVTQVRTSEKDGYEAIQVGFGQAKNVARPQEGHLKDAGIKTRTLREFGLEDGKQYKVGDKIAIELFEEGDVVNAQAVSKGKGFAGTIKRHNFHRGPKTHGSHNYRAPGSIGAMFPQHVVKGQKMPGRMGGDVVTTKNLKIAKVMTTENLILVRGAVPGPKKGIVLLTAKDKARKEEE